MEKEQVTSEEGDRRIAGHAAVTEKVCLDPSVAELTAYDAQGRVAYSRDIQENVAGLGCRRTVTARAPRPTTPRRRRSAIGYKKIACSAALFVRGNKESARFAALFADDEFAGESVGIARHALAARGAEKRLRTLLVI